MCIRDTTYGDGSVVELTPSGKKWTENILYDFSVNGGGPAAYAPLTSDKNGNLYGVAGVFGQNASGIVYELKPENGGWTFNVIYGFKGGKDGYGPASLIADEAGNLYGTTEIGGASTNCDGGGCGTVFKLTPTKNGWHETVVYSFQGGASGANPYGGLLLDKNGNLYGTTFYGGKKQCNLGCGVVFEIIP